MQNVKYSLTKYIKGKPYKISGYAKIDNENLYTPDKTYEDCIRYCHKILNKDNQYKGAFTQYEEIETGNQQQDYLSQEYIPRHRTIIELEVSYYLWFIILD